MRVLAVDVGGTHVKILATEQDTPRKIASSPTLTPRRMVSAIKRLARGWKYDVVSIGYPGFVLRGRPIAEPHNLGRGWVGFDFAKAFGRPVRVLNDAAMQALGSYKRGRMLFLGLGTGLGSSMIVDGVVEPMELAHLPYKRGTYEDYVGRRGLRRQGKKKWRRHVADVVARLSAALEPDEVVLGGGNVKKLKQLPPHCRAGDNANAFLGGFRLWEKAGDRRRAPRPKVRRARHTARPKVRRARRTARPSAPRPPVPRPRASRPRASRPHAPRPRASRPHAPRPPAARVAAPRPPASSPPASSPPASSPLALTAPAARPPEERTDTEGSLL